MKQSLFGHWVQNKRNLVLQDQERKTSSNIQAKKLNALFVSHLTAFEYRKENKKLLKQALKKNETAVIPVSGKAQVARNEGF